MLSDAPPPSVLSMLELHCILELMLPSCSSDAVAENDTELPCVNVEPVDGELIDTVGGVFGGEFIVTVMESVPERLPESVTVAVMV